MSLLSSGRQGDYHLATGYSESIPNGFRMLEWPCQGQTPERDTNLARGPLLAVTRLLLKIRGGFCWLGLIIIEVWNEA